MNLSSSIGEKKEERRGFFDSSLVVVSIIFFFVLAGFGGMRWYIKTLDNKLADLSAVIDQNTVELHSDKVSRVVAVDDRLKLIDGQKDGSVDTKKLLDQIEGLVVPQVRLTKYEYDKTNKTVLVAGDTESFKYVAQQIISLKSEGLFTGVRVESLDRTDAGRIGFSLKAQF